MLEGTFVITVAASIFTVTVAADCGKEVSVKAGAVKVFATQSFRKNPIEAAIEGSSGVGFLTTVSTTTGGCGGAGAGSPGLFLQAKIKNAGSKKALHLNGVIFIMVLYNGNVCSNLKNQNTLEEMTAKKEGCFSVIKSKRRKTIF